MNTARTAHSKNSYQVRNTAMLLQPALLEIASKRFQADLFDAG